MQDKKTITETKDKISEIALQEKFNGSLSPKGTLLMSFKLTVGRTSILGVDAVHNEAIISIFPYVCDSNIIRKYLMNTLGLLVNYDEQTAAIKGATLNSSKLKSLLIPVPPLAEQERIVKEIERFEPLLAEYDKLEQQATKLDTEIYDKLKKSILQYAIQGKLVKQDETDEPASILLERIRAEKKAQLDKKYVESYIYKGDYNCYYEKIGSSVKNITDEILFDIPNNWCWTRLNDICDYIHRGKSPTYGSSKILPIMAQKCNQWDKIYTDRCLFAEEKSIERYTDEQFLKLGDIIINSTGTGTVGRTGMIESYVFEKYSKFVADSHVTVVRVNSNLIPKYLYLFLISPQIQVDVESKCSGSTNQIELGTNTIKNYLIPLPPINEQQRIVRVYNKILYKIKDES